MPFETPWSHWMRRLPRQLPSRWLVLPLAGLAALAAAGTLDAHPLGVALLAAMLALSVQAAVHHAEVVAQRVGEPFGTLVLALAVTVIEASLIVSMMLAGGQAARTVPRDTVYAAVMIVASGTLGLCLLAGAVRHRVLEFRVDGTIPTLSVLVALSVLVLVLPNFTTSTSGPTFSAPQLVLAGLVSLGLYASFVFVQTVRHRDYFLPVSQDADPEVHALPPRPGVAWVSGALLLASLGAVVGLAKALAPTAQAGVVALGAPPSAVGVVIALLVLSPETWAAIRVARRNRLQTSLNLALGSGLATIGLTIPVVAALSVALDLPLELGLPPKEIVLMTLTLAVAAMSLSTGRATILQGCVHLALFAVFLFLAVVP